MTIPGMGPLTASALVANCHLNMNDLKEMKKADLRQTGSSMPPARCISSPGARDISQKFGVTDRASGNARPRSSLLVDTPRQFPRVADHLAQPAREQHAVKRQHDPVHRMD